MVEPRTLGMTGLQVTPIGLGLAALGRPAYMTLGRDSDLGADRSEAAFEERCHRMLDAAYAAGVRYVDAARSYGFAERFLASWLERRALAPGAITIGSKWGYTYVGSWQVDAPVHEIKDLSLDTLRRQSAESRATLGRYLCLYQIHSATIESGVLTDHDVIRELINLRSSGLVIGLTVTGVAQAETIRHALSIAVDGENPFQVVQATWNLLEPSAGDALAEAKARGWGVIVKEVFANGRLTNAHADASVEPLRQHAAAADVTLDALAIAAALSQPWVDTVLSGAVTEEQLCSHLSALKMRKDVVEDLPPIAEAPASYWHRRSKLAWS